MRFGDGGTRLILLGASMRAAISKLANLDLGPRFINQDRTGFFLYCRSWNGGGSCWMIQTRWSGSLLWRTWLGWSRRSWTLCPFLRPSKCCSYFTSFTTYGYFGSKRPHDSIDSDTAGDTNLSTNGIELPLPDQVAHGLKRCVRLCWWLDNHDNLVLIWWFIVGIRHPGPPEHFFS